MTSFFASRNFSLASSPLTLGAPVQESFGERRSITSAGKQLVIVFSECQVKPCVNAKERPFLVMERLAEDTPILATLNSLRSHFAEQLKVEESAFRPILTESKGLVRKSSKSLFLNLQPKASLTNLEKEPVDYESLVGKACKMGVFVHLASVFKGEDGMYSLQVKVSQMLLQETMEEAAKVEAVEIEQCNIDDTADLL